MNATLYVYTDDTDADFIPRKVQKIEMSRICVVTDMGKAL